MDVFVLLFVVSFLVLIFTLAVMHIRKHTKTKDNASKTSYVRSYDLESSMMQREVNEVQEKWKHTLPKHSTRIKLRNSRKLRNKRKGNK